MILGHLTVTYTLGDILRRCRFKIAVPLLVFGACLPDIIDKSLAYQYGIPTRGFAHSLLFQMIAAYLLLRFFPFLRPHLLTLFAGTLIHLIQDSPDTNTLLWPLLAPWEPTPSLTLLEKFFSFYIERAQPEMWWFEVAGILYIGGLATVALKKRTKKGLPREENPTLREDNKGQEKVELSMTNYASIDLGSNTIRLLVARPSEGGFDTLYQNQSITRLGEGVAQTGRLQQEAMARTIRAIASFKEEAAPYAPHTIWISATSAVRKASNGQELVERVKEETGLTIDIIPWEEEGRMMALGVAYGLKGEIEEGLLFDIGGGSTEFILLNSRGVMASAGTELGVVRLSETYLKKDPVDPLELSALGEEVEETLARVKEEIGEGKARNLIGTAGTVTTIAALDLDLCPYDPEKVNGHKIRRERIIELMEKLKTMTHQERGALPAIEKGREDLIIPGMVIVERCMATFGLDVLEISDFGLREGMLLDRLKGIH